MRNYQSARNNIKRQITSSDNYFLCSVEMLALILFSFRFVKLVGDTPFTRLPFIQRIVMPIPRYVLPLTERFVCSDFAKLARLYNSRLLAGDKAGFINVYAMRLKIHSFFHQHLRLRLSSRLICNVSFRCV